MAVGGSHFGFFRPFSGDKTTEVTVQGRFQRGIEKAESARSRYAKSRQVKETSLKSYCNEVNNRKELDKNIETYFNKYIIVKSMEIYRKSIRLIKKFVAVDKKV